ncbi:hypothetical protein ACFX2I_000098 [Malus domestica]
MVDAHLPKSKGKRKAEFLLVQHVPKKNSWPRLKNNLFSNEPPTEFSRPAVADSMSDSSVEGIDGPLILCNNCRAGIVLIKQKERPTPQQPSKSTTTQPKELDGGQHQKVFHRLGPQERTYFPTSARQRLDFDAMFYNKDYYLHNFSNSSSLANKKTSKPHESRDQL